MEICETSIDRWLELEVGDVVYYRGSYCIISYDYNEDMFPFGLIDLKTGNQDNYMNLGSILSEAKKVCKNEDVILELKNVKYL